MADIGHHPPTHLFEFSCKSDVLDELRLQRHMSLWRH